MSPFESLPDWPVDHVAAAVIGPDGKAQTFGDIDLIFELASITKLMTAMAVLVAYEEGTIDLDTPATPAGATAADLLAHSAGIAPERHQQMTAPHTKRIYSTAAYEMVADLVESSAGMSFASYLHEAVLAPLGMSATTLHGSPGAGARSTIRDLLRLAAAWHTPTLVDATTLARATSAHHLELDGVLPGFGRQAPNPWGLGPEIRGNKSPHWTAPGNTSTTFGHFGQTGTMLWIDPVAERAVIALSDRTFGAWAVDAWPRFSTDALAA